MNGITRNNRIRNEYIRIQWKLKQKIKSRNIIQDGMGTFTKGQDGPCKMIKGYKSEEVGEEEDQLRDSRPWVG